MLELWFFKEGLIWCGMKKWIKTFLLVLYVDMVVLSGCNFYSVFCLFTYQMIQLLDDETILNFCNPVHL